MKSIELANTLVEKLKQFEPFIYYISADNSSVYIHFRKLPKDLTHKLRISDHDERDRYGYKWQLRTDGVENIRVRKEYSIYFSDMESLITRFNSYYRTVKGEE